jgi:hypothetical protein
LDDLIEAGKVSFNRVRMEVLGGVGPGSILAEERKG